jgi:hypothetical protein
MAMLDAVFLAESADHANWSMLSDLVPQLPEGELRSALQAAVDEVEPQEDEHLSWAKDTKAKLVTMQIKSGTMEKMGEKAEEIVARIRNWFA